MSPLVVILAAVLLMAAVGAMADKYPVTAAPRLVLQSFAVTAALATFPPELQLLPDLPWWCERILLLVGTLWFVNLVNFMDGRDWMTVVEAVPITVALAVIGLLGYFPWQETVISMALCGAMIGFAFFNRPVAKLFLGDVGSLPIGLLLGWLLLVLARSSGRVAAFATAAILSCRQHHHAPAPGSKSRNGLAGPSIALLSTRHRRRFSRH